MPDGRVLAINSARMDDHSVVLASFLAAPGAFGVVNYWDATPHAMHRPAQGHRPRLRVSSHILLAWRGAADPVLPAAAPWDGRHFGVTTSAPLDAAGASSLARQATRRLGRLRERVEPSGGEAALDALWLKHLRRVSYVPDRHVFLVADGDRLGVVRGGGAPPLHIACDGLDDTDGIGDAPAMEPHGRQEALVASMPCVDAPWRPIAADTTLVIRGGRVRRAASGARRLEPPV